MKRSLKYLVQLLLLFSGALLTSAVFAQQPSLSLHSDVTNASVGQRFKITVTLENGNGNITPPKMEGFQVYGPSRSQSYQFINGRQSSSVSLIYIVQPLKTGDFTIGPVTADVGNKTLKSNAVKIHVVKGSVPPNSGGSSSGGNSNTPHANSSDSNLFLSLQLSKKTVYIGEQLTATYVLYSRYNNLNLDDYNIPTVDGFWTEDVKLSNNSWEPGETMINGYPYRKAVLKQQVLFPQHAGTIKLDDFTASCIVNRSFFNPGRTIAVKSNSPEVIVKPLPKGAPASFNGAVGNLSFSAKIDQNKVKANEAINLNVKISGSGNLHLLSEPKINFPSDFEVYDPKTEDHISTSSAGVSGSRTYQYLIIPRRPGDYKIAPIVFTYFDPENGKYKTLESDTFRIHVDKGDLTTSQAYVPSGKTDVTVLDSDIRYIHENSHDWSGKNDFFAGTSSFYLLWLGPVVLMFIVVFFLKRREKSMQDVVGVKKRRARKIAHQRLQTAKKALDSGNDTTFYEEISKALYGYLSDKLNISLASLNRPVIRESLAKHGVDENLSKHLSNTLDMCEMARFAAVKDVSKNEVYQSTLDLLGKLEESLKS